jgi:tRNA 2-thiocytidine biosynthesis protein TtcA
MAMRTILGAIKQADTDFHLIEDGDKIAVGVSGGKDSMTLLTALTRYRCFSKKSFQIIGIHVNPNFPNMDFTAIQAYCEAQGIAFTIIPSDPPIYDVLLQHLTKKGQLPCSICSKMRKAAMNKAAKALGCNKVAYAHHGDDAIETLLLNSIYGGRLATLRPKTYMSREQVTVIRPLLYCREKEIINTVKSEQIPLCISTCPSDKKTQREAMKDLLKSIYHLYPSAYSNFLLALQNTATRELWNKEENDGLTIDEE